VGVENASLIKIIQSLLSTHRYTPILMAIPGRNNADIINTKQKEST